MSHQWDRLVVWDGLPHQDPFFVIQDYDYITCSVTVVPLTMWFFQLKPKIDGHVISFAHWGCVSTMAHIGCSTRIGFLWRHTSMIGPTLHEYDQPTHYIDAIFIFLIPAKGGWDPPPERVVDLRWSAREVDLGRDERCQSPPMRERGQPEPDENCPHLPYQWGK